MYGAAVFIALMSGHYNVGMAVRLPILRRGWMTLVCFLVVASFTIIHFDVSVASIPVGVAGVWLFLSGMSGAWAYRRPVCGELFQLSELHFRSGYDE